VEPQSFPAEEIAGAQRVPVPLHEPLPSPLLLPLCTAMAADESLAPSQDEVARLAAVPSLRDALAGIGILPPIDPWTIFSRGRTPAQLPALFDSTLLATDDRPILEFSQAGDPLLWFFSNE